MEFEAEVGYTAELSFDDPTQTAHDSENGETYVFGSMTETVKDSTYVEGEVDIEVDFEDLSRSKIKSLFLPTDIGVPAPREAALSIARTAASLRPPDRSCLTVRQSAGAPLYRWHVEARGRLSVRTLPTNLMILDQPRQRVYGTDRVQRSSTARCPPGTTSFVAQAQATLMTLPHSAHKRSVNTIELVVYALRNPVAIQQPA